MARIFLAFVLDLTITSCGVTTKQWRSGLRSWRARTRARETHALSMQMVSRGLANAPIRPKRAFCGATAKMVLVPHRSHHRMHQIKMLHCRLAMAKRSKTVATTVT
jgi:hypothetical protein